MTGDDEWSPYWECPKCHGFTTKASNRCLNRECDAERPADVEYVDSEEIERRLKWREAAQ